MRVIKFIKFIHFLGICLGLYTLINSYIREDILFLDTEQNVLSSKRAKISQNHAKDTLLSEEEAKEECNRLGWKMHSTKPRIYYGVVFNEEIDLLEVVLSEVLDLVDVFILVEMNKTYQFTSKPLYFLQNKKSLCTNKFSCSSKIRHVILGDQEIIELHSRHDEAKNVQTKRDNVDLSKMPKKLKKSKAKNDQMILQIGGQPGSMRARIWSMEWLQRSSIAYAAAVDIKGDDIFIWLDIDELLSRQFLTLLKHCRPKGESWKIPIPMFRYNFSCKWIGRTWSKPAFSTGKELLRLLKKEDKVPWLSKNPDFVGRNLPIKSLPPWKHSYGWHMTSFGGVLTSRKKMRSYSHIEFERAGVANEPDDVLKKRINQCKRWDGYDDAFEKSPTISDYELPWYIAENKKRYVDLEWFSSRSR